MAVFWVLFSLFFSFGQSVSAAPEPPPDSINATMTKIGTVLGGAYPRLMSRRPLSEPEQVQLGNDLGKLTTLFRAAEPHIRQRSNSYQVSFEFVLEHLNQANAAVQNENFEATRRHLYSLATLCTSCHTQDSQTRTLFTGIGRSEFDNDLAYAEFNFSTRNYAQAKQYYEKYLTSAKSVSQSDFIRVMRRMVVIYAQVQNRPTEGAQDLRKLETTTRLTPPARKHLAQTIHGLEQLAAARVEEETNIGFETISKNVTRYLGNYFSISPVVFSTQDEDVARTWLRGVLFRYLSEKATNDEIPIILYWLSVCDRALGFDHDSSLADMYLRECVLKYSKHAYAQRCFEEYEHYVKVFFTTATEPYPPIEVRRDLEALRRALTAKPAAHKR